MHRNFVNIFFLLFIILGNSFTLMAQDSTGTAKNKDNQQAVHFIDEDGDGYNDNAPDHDGDGIPNGIDPDYQKMKAEQEKAKKKRYVDLDGDGINDYLLEGEQSGTSGLPQMKQRQNQGASSGSMEQNGQGAKGSGNKEKGKKAGGKR